MYLSRLTLNRSRMALLWSSNPYRVHQRLMMACTDDLRLLFRMEDTTAGQQQILVQSHTDPNWEAAFIDFPVLASSIECKSFEPKLQAGRTYRFRLLANPTIKKTVSRDGQSKKTRQGLILEEDQRKWLERKLHTAGSELLQVQIVPRGLQHGRKNPTKQNDNQVHLAVQFEGILACREPELLKQTVERGLGSAKGYGFGLLSLARIQ
jgi:CRISPR system Cascade subunit CasE